MKRQIFIDVAGLGGYVSLTYGVWQFSEPVAFIVSGGMALIFSVRASK